MDSRAKKVIKKRIGINIRIYEQKPSGIQNFIQCLFVTLIENYPAYHYIFFSTGKKKISKKAEHITAESWLITVLRKINPLLVNIFFDNIYVLRLIYSQHLDIFIAPSYILPLLKPKRTKYITVIHDLSYLTYKHNPFNLYMNYVMYMKFIIPLVLRRADRIVVPSLYVKHEIMKRYEEKENKISVVYEGKDDFFSQIKNKTQEHAVRTKYNISQEYCFTTATNHERKNIFGLIDAFGKIKSLDTFQLVITGLLPEFTIVDLKAYIRKLHLTDKVLFLGFVSKDELRTLYSYAKIFIFPSFEEGFGLPILESASCGCLPICSNTGSLPEIIGNKQLLFDPRNTKSIVGKLDEVLAFDQATYSRELSVVSRHIKQFTWDKTAEEWALLFNEIAN